MGCLIDGIVIDGAIMVLILGRIIPKSPSLLLFQVELMSFQTQRDQS